MTGSFWAPSLRKNNPSVGLHDSRFQQPWHTPKRTSRGKSVALVPKSHLSSQPRRQETGTGQSHLRKGQRTPGVPIKSHEGRMSDIETWPRTSEINNPMMLSGSMPFAPRIPYLSTAPLIAPVASRSTTANTGPVRKFTGRYGRGRNSDVSERIRNLTSAS